MRFAHGDYVKVAVPSDEVPSDCQAAPNIHIDAGDAVEPEFSSLLQTNQETHKMLSDQEVQPPVFVCDREPHAEEHRDGPGQDIDLDALQDAWHRAVVSLDSSTSSTGVNFATWYVNGCYIHDAQNLGVPTSLRTQRCGPQSSCRHGLTF